MFHLVVIVVVAALDVDVAVVVDVIPRTCIGIAVVLVELTESVADADSNQRGKKLLIME